MQGDIEIAQQNIWLQVTLHSILEELELDPSELEYAKELSVSSLDESSSHDLQTLIISKIRALKDAVVDRLVPDPGTPTENGRVTNESAALATYTSPTDIVKNQEQLGVMSKSKNTAESSMRSISSATYEDDPSRWVEYTELLPTPPFGMQSPVIDHLLNTWTTDKTKIDFLMRWVDTLSSSRSFYDGMESNGVALALPQTVQITGVSRVIRDGFLSFIIPIMRSKSVVPLKVTVRRVSRTLNGKSTRGKGGASNGRINSRDTVTRSSILTSSTNTDHTVFVDDGYNNELEEEEDEEEEYLLRLSDSSDDEGLKERYDIDSDPFRAMDTVMYDIRVRRIGSSSNSSSRTSAVNDVSGSGGSVSARARARTALLLREKAEVEAAATNAAQVTFNFNSSDIASLYNCRPPPSPAAGSRRSTNSSVSSLSGRAIPVDEPSFNRLARGSSVDDYVSFSSAFSAVSGGDIGGKAVLSRNSSSNGAIDAGAEDITSETQWALRSLLGGGNSSNSIDMKHNGRKESSSSPSKSSSSSSSSRSAAMTATTSNTRGSSSSVFGDLYSGVNLLASAVLPTSWVHGNSSVTDLGTDDDSCTVRPLCAAGSASAERDEARRRVSRGMSSNTSIANAWMDAQIAAEEFERASRNRPAPYIPPVQLPPVQATAPPFSVLEDGTIDMTRPALTSPPRPAETAVTAVATAALSASYIETSTASRDEGSGSSQKNRQKKSAAERMAARLEEARKPKNN